jgi:hypothetical protein
MTRRRVLEAGRKGQRRLDATPVVALPDANQRLAAAAEAAGLSVEELVQLALDSGLASPEAETPIVLDRYTVDDLGVRMWGDMQAVDRDRRGEWLHNLVPTQRNALVCALRSRGFASEVIARDLDLDTSEVVRIWNLYGADLGTQVVAIRLDTIAGQLQIVAERAQQMAVEAGDHSAYWRIQKELVSSLQDIGIVDKAIHKIEVSHKIDDAQKAELQSLLEFQKKREARLLEVEEIKQAEVKGDPIPDDLKTMEDE